MMPADKASIVGGSGWLRPLLSGLAGAAAIACVLMAVHPASAQMFDERYPNLQNRPRQNGPWQQPQWQQPSYSPFQAFPDQPQRQPRQVQADPLRPPPARTPATPPTVNIAVFGDSLAEWLAYGLEDAFAETPEIGILRKGKPQTGLIRVETRNESYDWPQQAREILAADKPDYVVMMIGITDRRGIREAVAPARKPAQKGPTQPQQAQKAPVAPAQPNQPPETAPKPAAQPDAEAPPEATPREDEQATPTETPTAGAVVHEFRTDKWGELYSKRIDEMIAVLKSRGVPVFWVGLPSIRGTRATSEMVYLNDLFRSRAEKAGITYIDIWDGFVDDAGNFSQYGADFEGQTRRLRTFDGVHFTKYGARKLAHYVEREIRRVMQTRLAPVATPAPEPEPEVRSPQQAAKPIASPVMSLTAPTQGGETLLGAAPIPAAKPDSVATRVLVRGEPLEAPAGRADDFAWPRRDVVTGTGVLPPDPVLPPPAPAAAPPTPVAAAPTTTPRAFVPRAPQQQRTTESWWRPWGQPDPRQQQRQPQNRYDNNQPSFFGNWFGR